MKQSLTTNRLFFYRILWALILCLSLWSLAPVVYAEETSLDFYVTPEFPESQVADSAQYFDLNAAPGSTQELTLVLRNAKEEPLSLMITPHTAYTNVHGVVEYGRDAEEPNATLTHSLSDMIEALEVELEGNETKTVTIPLTMPETAFDGLLAGGLYLSKVTEETTQEDQGEGVAITNEFSYVIGVVVSNQRTSILSELELLEVFADQLNARNVISATLQNPLPAFINRLAVEASVVREGEDGVLYEASEEMMQMAPNSHFHFPIPLNGDRFQAGDYRLKLRATSGQEEWLWDHPFTIEADEARALNRADVMIDTSVNWWMWGTIVLIMIITGGGLFLWFKKKKQTTKNEE